MKIQAYRCTWDGDTRGWMQYHDHTDPLPDEWDDAPPDEVAALVLKIDADIEIERLRAALTEARRWIGDGELSDGLHHDYWTPEYRAAVAMVDAALVPNAQGKPTAANEPNEG